MRLVCQDGYFLDFRDIRLQAGKLNVNIITFYVLILGD